MRAAVVHSFDRPPRYGAFPTPEVAAEHQVLVDVVAAGLHPRVRSSADGSHYTSDGTLPMVPGIDGVGRTAPGRAAVLRPARRGGGLDGGAGRGRPPPGHHPAGGDRRGRRRGGHEPRHVVVGGPAPPDPSSARRVRPRARRHRERGSARRPGRPPARRVPRGRCRPRPAAAGAAHRARRRRGGEPRTRTTPPTCSAAPAGDVDVVLDYLWGPPTEQALRAVLTARSDRAAPLAWVQLGSMAGPEITLRVVPAAGREPQHRRQRSGVGDHRRHRRRTPRAGGAHRLGRARRGRPARPARAGGAGLGGADGAGPACRRGALTTS